ncbi:protein FAR1-RELATED SEQUENCE 9-like [Actinidia eriantha]|uniref:protein FAR1-RELATED SEQUENCE 9-like n=1 Tax=Actinidia eriantha TaxID=165200 RepID=UPI00258EA3DE|nr:protein FAR1-RELATED SEQUENCE 9-like [Actinidia eriantha]
MEIEINGSSSPMSCEVLDIGRDESRCRRKLEFEIDDDSNMDLPIEDEGEEDESLNSVQATSDINLVHSKIPNEAIPKLGMKFLTEEAAYQFYNTYAYKVGFSVDEDDLITNIFWADAKMMADYANFGDVVCFDTTYRKNKDGRPFAMFVGVNHHKQTTIFGAALLYDETADSFMWLFDTFAKAMCENTPKTILTDQDAAMAKALFARWPGTVHRLCVWHIYQNAATNLSGVFARFKDFSKDFSECIYDYEDEADFIEVWNVMLVKYNLQENDWLRRMFNMKEKWALVYGRQTFCADLTTTQQSESMNSALKRYASYNNDLLRFFQNFQRLVDNHRNEELNADFRANQSTPHLSFPVQILKHAASIYTPDVFELFQRELSKAHDCCLQQCGENGTVTKYEITPFRKHHHHVVTYDSSEELVSCSCKKFEFGGILCSHALKVLSSNNIMKIPNRYILKRWTKNAKSGSIESTCVSTPVEDPKVMMGTRYKELCRLCTQLATRAAETNEAYKIALNALKKIAEEVDASLIGKTFHETPHVNITASQEINEATYGEGSQKKVKGLKVKKRTTKSSKRPRGALERAI